MEIIYLNEQNNLVLEPSCVALGFFDGFHLGHLKLVREVISVAEKNSLKKGLLTFDVQPKSFLTHQPFKYLMSLEDKIKLLKRYDFDYLFVLRFNNTLAKLEPKKFIEEYIIEPKIKHVVCGFDFHFGNRGLGDNNILIANSNDDYQVTVIEKLEYEHHKISSSYLRELLNNGDVETVTKLLNRPYSVSGEVIYGRQNGHKIGFPTANIDAKDYVLPQNGVYGAKVYIDDKVYLGMANLGFNPTFKTLSKASLEVNIFNFDEDVYGKIITIAFIKKIREERKFESVNKLIEQLNKDKQHIITHI
ncbi:MAG: bifunctional riboflavin kinase/FAD synthetase [Thomasclavelia sp.]|uniref:bifunctional riboflavin kinase/FAD synthetase n=1 Tax=Thomasclavelia sp. TaxID=3025757 RepID=UPI00399EFCE3